MIRDIWVARDELAACSLTRFSPEPKNKEDYWVFSMNEGPFSSYPNVNLNREDLVALRDALNEELGD